ncbi:MAG: hypothetical protein M1814_004731 [Vezdaea aestivalis]|nr:MAG: hypothetical protein M1814_004731 [Vezdaea aestivalis]
MSCQEQFDSLRASRTLEDEFIQGLIDKIKDMESKLVIEIADKERAEAGSKAFYNELSKVEKELKRIQSDQERKRYVLVLIDGDGLMFHDHLVSQAEIGGNKAGALLLEKVEKFVKELELGFEVDVVVKIYCNLKGMDKIYHQHGILSKAIGYDSFMRGLNKSSPSIDAIDAGNGKECADSKIHYNLSAAVANVQCKHIILGCSSDNGYARILTPLGNDPEKSSMISLLEGRPFAAELQALKSRFRTTEFKDIFRSEKWQAHRPPTGPSNLNGVHEVVNSKDSTKKPKTTKDILGDEGKDTTVQLDSEIVPRNRRGRRVDTRLEKVPYPLILEVKNRKYSMPDCQRRSGESHYNMLLEWDHVRAGWNVPILNVTMGIFAPKTATTGTMSNSVGGVKCMESISQCTGSDRFLAASHGN